MKKMIRTTSMSISFVVAFMLLGFQSVQAQFVDGDSAIDILTTEISDLQVTADNTTAGTTIHLDLVRKIRYYRFVAKHIIENDDVAQAIADNYDAVYELSTGALSGGPAPSAASSRKALRTSIVQLLQ